MENPSKQIDSLEAELRETAPVEFPEPLTMKELMETDFPPIRFTVEDFVLDDEVNLLYGKGGVGKSVTSTQMGVSVAAGKPFFGRKTIQRPVILVLSEDQYPKTKERIVAHCKAIDVNPIDLPLQPWCLRGEDLSMAKITDEGAVTLLPFYKALEAKMAATPGAFVVLDGLADVGQMSEKDRVPVTAFMKKVLGKLSVKYSATIRARPSEQGSGSRRLMAFRLNSIRERCEEYVGDETRSRQSSFPHA